MNKTIYEQFDEAFRHHMSSKLERKGQATFNAVMTIDPVLADSLRGTNIDCYYFDGKINDFMSVVYNKWSSL